MSIANDRRWGSSTAIDVFAGEWNCLPLNCEFPSAGRGIAQRGTTTAGMATDSLAEPSANVWEGR